MRGMVSDYRKGLTPRTVGASGGDDAALSDVVELPFYAARAPSALKFCETPSGVLLADRRPLSGNYGFLPLTTPSRGRGVIVPDGLLLLGQINTSTNAVIATLNEKGEVVRQSYLAPTIISTGYQGGAFDGQRLVMVNTNVLGIVYSDDFGATLTNIANNLALPSSSSPQYIFHDGADFVFVIAQSTAGYVRSTPDGITVTNRTYPPITTSNFRPVYTKKGSGNYLYNASNGSFFKWDVTTKAFVAVAGTARTGNFDFFEEIDGKFVGIDNNINPRQISAAFPDGSGAVSITMASLVGPEVVAAGVTGYSYPTFREMPDGRILFAVQPSGGSQYPIEDDHVVMAIFKNLDSMMMGNALKRSSQRQPTDDLSSFLTPIKMFATGRNVAT